MRFAVLALMSLAVASVSGLFVPHKITVTDCHAEFAKWMIHYKKAYDPSELFFRFTTFCNSMDEVHAHNVAKLSYTKAINQFAAHSKEEYNALLGYRHINNEYSRNLNMDHSLSSMSPPSSIDWTTKGAVTAVKNQGQCGSCWSFSTTGSVEGAWQIKGHPLVSLSEQQLMDCSTAFGNEGCDGGLMDNAFQWIINNSGITSDANDPYVSGSGTDPITKCQKFPSVAKISSYKDVASNEKALMNAVALGPVSVAIEADQMCFQFYSSGVLSSASCACGSELDHGVLVVGYGHDSASGLDYWKIKNSWASIWGDNGYVLIQRGGNSASPAPQGGMCGVLTAASYPIV